MNDGESGRPAVESSGRDADTGRDADRGAGRARGASTAKGTGAARGADRARLGHGAVAALVKLGVLAASVTALVFVRDPLVLAGALLIVAALAALLRLPARRLARLVLPVCWILLVAVPVNALFSGWESAAAMGLRILIAVSLAAVFTLVTPVPDLLDGIGLLLHPLRGRIDTDRIGLVLALTIRAVPLIAGIVRSVLEARRARGVEHSLRAVAVPVVVRTLQTADELGEALAARGVDD